MRKLLVCMLGILMSGTVMAQDTIVISPALEAHLDSLEQFTTEIRGLPTLEEVELFFPTAEELKAFLEEELETSLTDEVLHEAMAFYTAFDFLPPDTDLLEIIMALYEDQVAGFYNTDNKGMNVILLSGERPDTRLPLLERVTFVHEYTHALQDQHFDLKAYLDEEAVSDDRSLARQALVEGDASYVMTLYTVQTTQDDPGAALLELFQGALASGSLSFPPGTPSILAAELLFPYEAGQAMVEALFNVGGWEMVNDAYVNPPESTEQVLHPEKYIAGEAPVEVTLPDQEGLLSGGWTGWTLVDEGTMGEFYLRQYLRTLLTWEEVIPAAAGWGGDAYKIYQNDSGAQAWQLKIAWDSAAEMAEFKTAFDKFMTLRTGIEGVESCYLLSEMTFCADYSSSDNTVLITMRQP
jgi:hypothetical protein